MAMDFKSARKRVGKLLAPPARPQDLPTSGLKPDLLRDNIVEEAISDSPRIEQALGDVPNVSFEDEDGNAQSFDWTSFGDVVRDVARANFDYADPELRSRGQVRPSHAFNREVLSEYLSSEEHRESRYQTRGKAPDSWFSAMAAADKLKEMAPEVAEHLDRANKMDEAEEEQQSAEDALEQLRQRAKRQKETKGKVADATANKVKAAVKQREKAKAALKQLAQAHGQSKHAQAARKIGQAAAKAAAEAAEAMAVMSMFGTEAGNASNLPLAQQVALAEKWAQNPEMLKIIREVGRWIKDFKFKRATRSKDVKIEPVGITTGREVEHQLPHEAARANMPALRPLWMKDFAERSLLVHELEGDLPAGHGPVIGVFDGSGSMDLDFGGCSRFTWASSLMLTLLQASQREKRDFYAIEFGSRSELKTWEFLARRAPDPDLVLDLATHFFAGGTNIAGGLAKALEVIQNVEAFKMADIVLITDGQCSFTEQDTKIVSELRKLGVRIHGISIACPDNAYMGQACDYVVDVADLADAGAATGALANNMT